MAVLKILINGSWVDIPSIKGVSAYDIYKAYGGTLEETAFNTLIGNIDNITTNAIEATNDANEAADLANNKANLANTKANLADEKAGLADQKATEANNAANSANGAAMTANQATNNAIEATESVSNTEQTVQANEVLRSQAEDARDSSETSRVSAESTRANSETTRNTAEQNRTTAETARVEAEGDATKGRVKAENDRVAAETLRQQQEALRVQAEIDRVNSGAVIRSQIVNNLTESEAGKVLDARQGKILNDNVWSIFDVIGWYGVSWDTAVSTTPMTRTGNAQMHRALPIQSKMRGCLVSDSGVVTYLPATWSNATLDGSAGQVMVEIPQHYRYFPPANGTIMECRISEYPLPNFTLVPKSYISAYEATVARSTNKLSSVVNATAEYRGGNNSATNDANPNTLLGKPATNLTRAQFRSYARNRGAGWEMLDYKTYNTLFWLYFIEYANMNSQLAVNSALDGNGYKQGGLGNGVTDIVAADWGTFNGYYPIINCGASNSLGNGSGEVSYTVPFTVPVTTKVNRYRGIENPFGHIWKNCDGIIFDIKTDADGGTSNIYICSVPSNYSDSVTANYTLIGQIPRSDGYIKTLQAGSFLPLTIGAGSTTYWCDYFYQSIASSSLRTLILGGIASYVASAGLGCSYASSSVSYASAYFGSRLCFFPQ